MDDENRYPGYPRIPAEPDRVLTARQALIVGTVGIFLLGAAMAALVAWALHAFDVSLWLAVALGFGLVGGAFVLRDRQLNSVESDNLPVVSPGDPT